MKSVVFVCVLLTSAITVASDPFDPARVYRIEPPRGTVSISQSKVLVNSVDMVRASLLMRNDIQQSAKGAGLEIERITPRKPQVLDAETGIYEMRININLIGDVQAMIDFFEDLDRANRGFGIERLDLMRHVAPVETTEEEPVETNGVMMFARLVVVSLGFRLGEVPQWPEGSEIYRRIGVVPALIHELSRLVPRNAWLTELALRKNEVRIQGRTERSDTEGYYEILHDIPFLVNVQPERPNTVGRVRSKILFAGSATIADGL